MATIKERILRRVVIDANGCWIWQGAKTPKGYGHIRINRISRRVHRLAYQGWVGEIPAGLVLDHTCKVRACANPAHLEPVTIAENTYRGENQVAINARKTECVHGHPFDLLNTRVRVRPDGSVTRDCRTCDQIHGRARSKRASEQRRAAA